MASRDRERTGEPPAEDGAREESAHDKRVKRARRDPTLPGLGPDGSPVTTPRSPMATPHWIGLPEADTRRQETGEAQVGLEDAMTRIDVEAPGALQGGVGERDTDPPPGASDTDPRGARASNPGAPHDDAQAREARALLSAMGAVHKETLLGVASPQLGVDPPTAPLAAPVDRAPASSSPPPPVSKGARGRPAGGAKAGGPPQGAGPPPAVAPVVAAASARDEAGATRGTEEAEAQADAPVERASVPGRPARAADEATAALDDEAGSAGDHGADESVVVARADRAGRADPSVVVAPSYNDSIAARAYDDSVVAPAYDDSVVAPAYDDSVVAPAYDDSVVAPASHAAGPPRDASPDASTARPSAPDPFGPPAAVNVPSVFDAPVSPADPTLEIRSPRRLPPLAVAIGATLAFAAVIAITYAIMGSHHGPAPAPSPVGAGGTAIGSGHGNRAAGGTHGSRSMRHHGAHAAPGDAHHGHAAAGADQSSGNIPIPPRIAHMSARARRRQAARLMHLARRLDRHHQYGRAEEMWKRAWQHVPNTASVASGLSTTLLHEHHDDDAVTWARLAAHLNPHRAAYQIALGDALAAKHDTAGARTAYERAVHLDRHNRIARRKLLALHHDSPSTSHTATHHHRR